MTGFCYKCLSLQPDVVWNDREYRYECRSHGVMDLRSSANVAVVEPHDPRHEAEAMEHWSDIALLCHRDSVLLERNDGDWRPAIDDLGSIEHKDHCWLGKNYEGQPEARARGCDCGVVKEAIQRKIREAT